jgi:hypothetical protein
MLLFVVIIATAQLVKDIISQNDRAKSRRLDDGRFPRPQGHGSHRD